MPEDYLNNDWLFTTAMQHSKKNFVSRLLNPYIYPVIPSGDGGIKTHVMSYSEVDGKHIVYPRVIQSPDGSLVELAGDEAVNHALMTGEFIPFDKESEASYFSKNYKNLWGNK